MALLFSVEPACQERGLSGVGIYCQVSKQFAEEGFAARTYSRRGCAINAVNQFGQTDGTEGRVLISGSVKDSLDQMFDRFPATFRSDDDAGVED